MKINFLFFCLLLYIHLEWLPSWKSNPYFLPQSPSTVNQTCVLLEWVNPVNNGFLFKVELEEYSILPLSDDMVLKFPYVTNSLDYIVNDGNMT